MVNSLQPSFKWVGVARDVYENYLKPEFTDPSCQMDWKFEDRLDGKIITVHRPNHGLAHTLRCPTYLPFVSDAFTKFRNIPPISSHDIENMQLVLVFYVVGRENDAGSKEDPYLKFRQKSAAIFKVYMQTRMPSQFTVMQIDFYQKILTDSCEPNHPHYVIIRLSHNIDLLRCVPREIYEKSQVRTLALYIGKVATKMLKRIVEECLRKTGDRIYEEKNYEPLLFIYCSTNVYFCLKQINQAIYSVLRAEAPYQGLSSTPTAHDMFSVLSKLIEHPQVQQHLALPAVLDAKVELLFSLPPNASFDIMNQRFWRLAKRLINEENRMSETVLGLLLESNPSSEPMFKTASLVSLFNDKLKIGPN